MPRCEDGEILVLKNPGECQAIHECGRAQTYPPFPEYHTPAIMHLVNAFESDVASSLFDHPVCKKENCALSPTPACGANRHLTVKKTKCCDVFECSCSCRNVTRTCPAGFITASKTDDCGCTEISCVPDKVSPLHFAFFYSNFKCEISEIFNK